MISWIAHWMRTWADRIDPHGAPRQMSQMTFTFEIHEGIVIRNDNRGCPLWYLGRESYERAFNEADTEWKAL